MTGPFHRQDRGQPIRLARSAVATAGAVDSAVEFHRWFTARAAADPTVVTRIDFSDLINWRFHPETGNLVHESGKFFAVEGLRVNTSFGPVPHWSQPIIDQPETGVLGILVKQFDGVLHCLMQAKMEPGNHNTLQLSPTVQATISNYTAVHHGRPVPYLEYFSGARPDVVLADVLQSEQGSWFYCKRNRNMVVETAGPVPVRDGFRWLSLGQLYSLLAYDDLLNMNTRTVLSCLPFSGGRLVEELPSVQGSFRAALVRSLDADQGALHTSAEILSWVTGLRARREVVATRITLPEVRDWTRRADRIEHDSGAFFDIRAVAVDGGNREVNSWTQPMIAPHGLGVIAFLAARMRGVLHVLVNARSEPGFLDFVELAPTVQCTPDTYDQLPSLTRPPFLDDVLGAPPDRIRFDTILSEEGGRFFHARNRYLVIEVDPLPERTEPDSGPSRYRWMTVGQLVGLTRYSHYVNVQARSLIACLHSLIAAEDDRVEARSSR
ncbi:NDP-hexose 2,3-dehydratase [Nocardia sp. SYP-A9097]|uniref:NDP-hexose 2,3-dehydratase family protein n=1 Tax=Nocardia sp. SYP-A9097 TaxID=2663237 RepID=UPI00129BB11D|nr:NDP-hexose 2,3-dehydratase family protein [Nocardia sp. SYP-A9097]MRH92285.1 NDP-hexose 2,3-dehydratase [Nocardia sp. SYP-A9097]